MAFDENGTKPEKIWARLKDFIGQSIALDNPEAIYKDLTPPKLTESELHGTEAIAAVKFKEKIYYLENLLNMLLYMVLQIL